MQTMSEVSKKKTVELMIEQERLLSGLYKIFSANFPDHKNFWLDLSADEARHATWLEQLSEALQKGQTFLDQGKINPQALKTFIDHLKSNVRMAEQRRFTLVRAVSLALDLERSLIEKNAFVRFDSDSKYNKAIIQKLISETKAHIARVENMAKKIRSAEQK